MNKSQSEYKEFSLLVGAGLAGGIHVGMNVLYKGMLKPKTALNRVGAAVFQTGVRHGKEGMQIHPAITKISDIVAGPEMTEIYKKGLHSSRAFRKQAAIVASYSPGVNQQTKGMAGIIHGPRSKITENILSKFKKVPLDRKPKVSDHIAAAATGLGMAAAEPIYPAYNAVRTAVSRSKFGKKILKDKFKEGINKGAKKGIGRHIEDYLGSPALNAARDAGDNVQPLRSGLFRR